MLFRYLFRNWPAVVGIIVTLALSAASVFLGLWMTGTELNISAMMGLTMVISIVAELGGLPVRTAGRSATRHGQPDRRRSRASATHPDVGRDRHPRSAPLALGLGEGSAMQKPLAIAIITGLLTGVPPNPDLRTRALREVGAGKALIATSPKAPDQPSAEPVFRSRPVLFEFNELIALASGQLGSSGRGRHRTAAGRG